MARIINDNEFINEVESSKGVAVVDFFAPWCGPCKMLSPIFEELGVEMEGKANFLKVDVDQSAAIARKYKIMGVPSIMIFKDGNPVERVVGFVQKEDLSSKVGKHL